MAYSPERSRLYLWLCLIIGLLLFISVQPSYGQNPETQVTSTATPSPMPVGDMGSCALSGTVMVETHRILQPLAGVTVTYDHRSYVRAASMGQTATDENGHFSFPPILIHDTDSIIIQANIPGYAPVRIMQGGVETWPGCQFDLVLVPDIIPPPNPVTRNADWTPVVHDFDGVVMVLVPPGCFMMGSEWTSDQKPVHEQCFEDAFWIDRTEVTQAQFRAFEGEAADDSFFTGDELPREQITWVEARAFCEQRGARLPTEAEWEYAARGPDNLVFPWGNIFEGEYTIYAGSSNEESAPVGSLPEGMSWVGALDMSGNVWEWVSSLYRLYPYDATDGRENVEDVSGGRVARGGGLRSTAVDFLRASVRSSHPADQGSYEIGFRCARAYE